MFGANLNLLIGETKKQHHLESKEKSLKKQSSNL
jgi:hypothetical protein